MASTSACSGQAGLEAGHPGRPGAEIKVGVAYKLGGKRIPYFPGAGTSAPCPWPLVLGEGTACARWARGNL